MGKAQLQTTEISSTFNDKFKVPEIQLYNNITQLVSNSHCSFNEGAAKMLS